MLGSVGEALSGAQDDVAAVGGPALQQLRTLADELEAAIQQLTAAAHGAALTKIEAQLGGQVAAVQNTLSGVGAMLAMAADSTADAGADSVRGQLTKVLERIWRLLNSLSSGDGGSVAGGGGGGGGALDRLLQQAAALAEAKLNDLWQAAGLASLTAAGGRRRVQLAGSLREVRNCSASRRAS